MAEGMEYEGKPVICETCQVRQAIGVASTSMPYSAAFCRECAEAGVEPYWVIVCQTACLAGMQFAAEWWIAQVDRVLAYLGKTRAEFDADVAKEIEKLNNRE